MTDQTALTKVSNFFDSPVIRQRFADTLGDRSAGAYITSVLIAVAGNERLQQCTLSSIYTSALRAASLRLSVDQSAGQAYLVPFKNKAQLIVGYKGLRDMAIRTGKYRYLNVGPVFEGETVTQDRYSGWHKLGGEKISDKIIGYLGAFELFTGYGHTIYLTIEEIHAHAKRYSKSYDFADSIWKTDTAKMERKTCLRLLLLWWGELDPVDRLRLEEAESGEEIDISDIEVTAVEDTPKQKRTEHEILSELGYREEELDRKEQAAAEIKEGEFKPAEQEPEQEPAKEPAEKKKQQKSRAKKETAPPADVPETQDPPKETEDGINTHLLAEAWVGHGIASSLENALGIIENYLPEGISWENAISWGRLFRGWRDIGAVSADAAARATAGEIVP